MDQRREYEEPFGFDGRSVEEQLASLDTWNAGPGPEAEPSTANGGHSEDRPVPPPEEPGADQPGEPQWSAEPYSHEPFPPPFGHAPGASGQPPPGAAPSGYMPEAGPQPHGSAYGAEGEGAQWYPPAEGQQPWPVQEEPNQPGGSGTEILRSWPYEGTQGGAGEWPPSDQQGWFGEVPDPAGQGWQEPAQLPPDPGPPPWMGEAAFPGQQPPPGAPSPYAPPPPEGMPYPPPNQFSQYPPPAEFPGGEYPPPPPGPEQYPAGPTHPDAPPYPGDPNAGPPHPGSGYPGPPGGPQEPPPPGEPQRTDNLNRETLLRGRSRAPSKGWRRAVYRVSGGTIDPGESPAELRRRHLLARGRTVVAGGHHRVAVLSLKGGVGKTTTTIGLGSTLAALRGDRVVAIDANPDRGTLSDKLHLETAATVRDLLNERENIRRYADVRAFTSQAASRLEVLASDRDPAVSEAFSDEDYRAVSRVLEHFYSICITDCGTGLLHSAMSAVLRHAHQIVLVSSPSVDGARSASATLDWLEAHQFGHLVRTATVVLSGVREKSKSSVDVTRLESHFASRCQAVVRIPYDPHLEEGAEVELDQLKTTTRDAYLVLAATVGDGFGQHPAMMPRAPGMPPPPGDMPPG